MNYKFQTLVLLLILLFVLQTNSVQAESFEYHPGTYKNTLNINVGADKEFRVRVVPEVGNRAYDWTYIDNTLKEKYINSTGGVLEIPYVVIIPKNGFVGNHSVMIAYNNNVEQIRFNVMNKYVYAIREWSLSTTNLEIIGMELSYIFITIMSVSFFMLILTTIAVIKFLRK